MASTSNNTKLSLKIMVDMKAKKVVFAEADKEFVDFIFSLMSLPLSVATKLLLESGKGIVGSLGDIYKSIDTLDTQCFDLNVNKEDVLKPKAPVNIPLLAIDDLPVIPIASGNIYTCTRDFKMSDVPGTMCPSCGKTMKPMRSYTYVPPEKAECPEYVQGGTVYMVTDCLEVKPLSMALIRSCVRDFYDLEEKHVDVGFQEGLAILKASFETKNVLTSVFL